MRALLVALLVPLVVGVPAAAAGGTTISGRILDTQGGLTVPNATVELERNGTRVATARTDAGGNFRILDQPPGTYAVLIRAAGYQTTRILPDLLVTAEIPEVAFQTAIARQPQGL
ncbi:MAG TPA: carboxypeptidase-like regulatory domain-containing protein, partial [Candidatus Acidoferrum sp.]|nr:carboxypeptidase-like regulatory domain-containing protein [Candidatus Acidoferrum sp.]